MAAHLAKQIPEAPDGSQSISSTILASCLFSAFNGNSLDELSASLAVLQTDEFKVMLNRLLVQMQGFDWLFFIFFFPSTFDECKRDSSRCFLLLL